MNQNPTISIVSPVYNAEKSIKKLVFEIEKSLSILKISYEIILVDDRSLDNSWSELNIISINNPNVTAVRLSKNFGQHPAIIAGLTISKGEWIVVMDCDLQDQPKEIEKLYNKAIEGYDIVLAKRKARKDGFVKKITSKIYTKIFNYLANSNVDSDVANFGIYNKKVIKEVLNIGDFIKAFQLFVYYTGFKTTSIFVEHAEREIGKSAYTLSKSVSLAFNAIISYSTKPLKIFITFGLLVSTLAFFGGIYNLYGYYAGSIKVLGYSSIIISIWFFSGIIITSIGVVGIYIGKVFEQTKNRPVFIIDEILKKNDDN